MKNEKVRGTSEMEYLMRWTIYAMFLIRVSLSHGCQLSSFISSIYLGVNHKYLNSKLSPKCSQIHHDHSLKFQSGNALYHSPVWSKEMGM
jgi:hypothetical protein